jgi:hypothetical protein
MDLIPDNGIVERFHKTMLDEFYRIGKTPLHTFLDALPIAREKCLPVTDGDQTAAA